MSFFRLTLLYSLSILFCGRVGLLIHEIIGHGLVAELLGAQVTRVELHWFGGGSVYFSWNNNFPQIYKFFIYFGGIFFELVTAGCLLIFFRKHQVCLAQLLAYILILHGLFYWSTSTHGEYGDGRRLEQFFLIPKTFQVFGLTILFWLSCYPVAQCLWDWSYRLKSHDSIVKHIYTHGFAVILAITCHGLLSFCEVQFFNKASPEHNLVFEPEYSFKLNQLKSEYVQKNKHEPDLQWLNQKTLELQPWPNYPIFLIISGLISGLLGVYKVRVSNSSKIQPSLFYTVMATAFVFISMWIIKSQ